MIRKFLLAFALSLISGYGFSQQTLKAANDSTSRKGSHQLKTIDSKVIKLDKPVNQNNHPLPPMKTRKDTLMYLIHQHKQNKDSIK